MLTVLEKLALHKVTVDDVLKDSIFLATINSLKARTERWAKKMGYANAQKYPPEVQEWIDFFKDHRFEGCRSDVIALVSKLKNVDLEVLRISSEDKVLYEIGVFVVPLGNDNGHDYSIGRPCVSYRTRDIFVAFDGRARNSLTRTKELVRPATNKEIDEYILNLLRSSPTTLGTILEVVL